VLGDQRDDFSSGLINGTTLYGGQGTAEATAKVIGIIYGVDLLLDMEVEDE